MSRRSGAEIDERPRRSMFAPVDRTLRWRVYSNRFHVVARYHFTMVMQYVNRVHNLRLQNYDAVCAPRAVLAVLRPKPESVERRESRLCMFMKRTYLHPTGHLYQRI